MHSSTFMLYSIFILISFEGTIIFFQNYEFPYYNFDMDILSTLILQATNSN